VRYQAEQRPSQLQLFHQHQPAPHDLSQMQDGHGDFVEGHFILISEAKSFVSLLHKVEFLSVVHVVYSETSLVDEVILASVRLSQQLIGQVWDVTAE